MGCRNGDTCRFDHVDKAPCSTPNCNDRKCEFSHFRKQINDQRTNVNFPRNPLHFKPPWPQQQTTPEMTANNIIQSGQIVDPPTKQMLNLHSQTQYTPQPTQPQMNIKQNNLYQTTQLNQQPKQSEQWKMPSPYSYPTHNSYVNHVPQTQYYHNPTNQVIPVIC